jgi:hypothetical protein
MFANNRVIVSVTATSAGDQGGASKLTLIGDLEVLNFHPNVAGGVTKTM